MKNLIPNQHLIDKLGAPPEYIKVDEFNKFFNKAVEVLKKNPKLNENGFDKVIKNPNTSYDVILEAYICSLYLKACTYDTEINANKTSYGFKHQVEAWIKFYPKYPISYISNSAFILAYLMTGQPYKRIDPNIHTTIIKYPDLLTPSNFIRP